jgi:hypothetical protein
LKGRKQGRQRKGKKTEEDGRRRLISILEEENGMGLTAFFNKPG